jgi:hypothetical protein
MDEVDARPGHVALQFGHLDAIDDAPKPSLRPHLPTLQRTVILIEMQWSRRNFSAGFIYPFPLDLCGSRGSKAAKTHRRIKIYENVSGK